MPCYKPLTAYHTTGGNITFDHNKAFFKNKSMQLPCGRCLGCRLERAKEWALRCSYEASLNDKGLNNSFVTLTYDEAHLPANGNLRRIDFQKFIRSLRKRTRKKIRYFMCGEYGEKENRPHYHALLFGHQFDDKILVNIRNGNRVYTSKTLDKIWQHGTCEIGSVTFQSAGYVARYIVKKQTGTADELFKKYVIIDPETGEMTARHNEYTNMSLKPGIGEKFYEKFKSDFFPQDFAVLPDGRTMSVPTYYRRLLEKSDPEMAQSLRDARIEKAAENPNNTPERLAVREICHTAKTLRLKRDQL